MSEPRPDEDQTAVDATPPIEGDASSGSTGSAGEVAAADTAASEATPPPAYAPPPMTAYTPPPVPPATNWAGQTATSPTPPSGTPVQSTPDASPWVQPPTAVYQPAPAGTPEQQGWPQPPTYQQPQSYGSPPAYPQPYTAPPVYPQQQPYQQPPPGYPPQQAWQQPAQTGWVQPQGEGWAPQGGPGVYAYKSSALAILAGVWLLLVGLLTTLLGVVILLIGNATNRLQDFGVSLTPSEADAVRAVLGGVAVFVLICGILMLVSAIGIWAHKSWGRIIGIIFSVLGVLFGLAALSGGNRTTTLTDGQIADATTFGLALLVLWGLCLLFLIISGGHFHRQRVG
jgi:uncharacterized membrane protein (DUF2068 family)